MADEQTGDGVQAAGSASSRGAGLRVTREKRVLRGLVVEDSLDDAELLARELRAAGLKIELLRVDTLEQLARALDEGTWDVVLADYKLPGFTALESLEMVKRTGRDIPFIIVSGSVGEESAVEAMKAGAHDFFIKDRLTRLGSAIEREVREAGIRGERRAATTLLDSLYETAPIGLAFLDDGLRFVRINESLAALSGLPAPAHIGWRVRDLLPELGARMEEKLLEVFATGRPIVDDEISGETPGEGGKRKHWLVSYCPIREREGPLLGLGLIVRDVSDRQQAEVERERLLADLRRAVQARDEFLSIASHELKTPITSLELQVESALRLMRLRGEEEIPRRKFESKLEGASRQIERLTMLINNLLDVTRIAGGQLAVSRAEVDLKALAQGVLARLHEVIQRSGSQVTLSAPAAVVGSWDPLGLETVLANLISNAAKFGDGKPIEVTVEGRGDRARMVVTDHGLGIAAEDQQRLFERFERAVPVEHYGGFGLGLWIARNIVEAHGGTIRVSSEKGAGSTFSVEVPFGPDARRP